MSPVDNNNITNIQNINNNRLIKNLINQYFSNNKIHRIILEALLNIDNETIDEYINDIIHFKELLTEINKSLFKKEKERLLDLKKELLAIINDPQINSYLNNTDSINNMLIKIEQDLSNINTVIKQTEYLVKLIDLRKQYIDDYDLFLNEIYDRAEILERLYNIDNIDTLISKDKKEEIIKEFLQLKRRINIRWIELKSVIETFLEYETLITKLQLGLETDKSISELINELKSYIYKTSIELTKIVTDDINSNLNNNNKEKNENKKFLDKLSVIQITDEYIIDEVSNFISEQYSSFNTGLTIFDDKLTGGIESGSVYLIAAPTNHGKTLLLIMLLYSILSINREQFNNKDAILFITLEDSNIKVLNRIYSVFGNYPYKSLTQIQKNFKYIAEYIKSDKELPDNIKQEKLNKLNQLIRDTYDYLKKNSIDRITDGKVEIFIQDAREKKNEYSVIDIITTIEQLKILGYNIRAVIIDYIELMSSTKKYEQEHREQGQIVVELRNLANTYMIPVIAATQLNRSAENLKTELTNQVIGESYNKAKYSDYIVMIRQIKTDIFNNEALISNDDEDNSNNNTSRRKKRKDNLITDISELLKLFMPRLQLDTKLRNKFQQLLKDSEIPNCKIELINKNRTQNTNIINASGFQPFNLINNNTIDNNISMVIDNNPIITEEQEIDDITNDLQIVSDMFRLVEYSIPKSKDGINIPSKYDIVNTIKNKLSKQYPPEVQNLIEYKKSVIDKGLIYENVTYNLDIAARLNDRYLLFSKYNLRIYSIPELPLAIYDHIICLNNLIKLKEYIQTSDIYKELCF